ncbi:class I SAM-dependent methyltransferase [Oscillatoria sp. CS-180]|uniref:class I SAM-dependent methyltransferase n=1 Tax=Oscillatoria sp. CS-180 TaxID=3021720 RepID=UPI00232F7934|nr:class I SAM-dependent methyltransferase [Oscillatoria sp. CS-180]MDB9524828.1 class I SAM-dependent methyltransferase [Oscillatoria sp. CS-180]
MDVMGVVSETALITLKARVIETEKPYPIIQDVVSKQCLSIIQSHLPADVQNRILNRKLPSSLTSHIALRTRKYDTETSAFIANNPSGLVVSLGCGFDTRYWRVSDKAWNYVEIDLPEVVAIKQAILADRITYPMIGCSVLDDNWIEAIQQLQTENVFFIAEGLLMYLAPADIIRLFDKLSQSFTNSFVLFEIVHRRYTQGLWKKNIEAKMKRALGTDAGAVYQFGIATAGEVETYGNDIKVIEEWSYFQDEDIRPKFLRLFRHLKFFTRSQWTIKAKLN